MSIAAGTLYIVATPIGNLGDFSPRATDVLKRVDLILAEDTRRTRKLLAHYGIETATVSMHEHNEDRKLDGLLDRLQHGMSLAMVSDAGTPLISDPGFPLVREARRRGFRVSPVPGPSALTSALSASGLSCDRFVFEGFPPRTSGQRRALFAQLAGENRTLVFYESNRRCLDTLRDMHREFGSDRDAVVAREISKLHETFLSGTLEEIIRQMERTEEQNRGEFVLMISGSRESQRQNAFDEGVKVLRVLLEELPVKQAVALAARISGARRNDLYRHAVYLGHKG